jgi:hypothetical protein
MAAKRVVNAHFQTSHGQYAGSGLKEIDIEGQKFKGKKKTRVLN